MKTKHGFFLILTLLVFSCGSGEPDFEMIEPVSIIPMPGTIEYATNSFVINPDTKIVSDAASMREATFLKEVIIDEFEHELEIVTQTPEENYILISLLPVIQNEQLEISKSEAYELSIIPNHIEVIAKSNLGLFWAIQTLNQTFNQTDHQDGYAVRIQSMHVKDEPKFKHRGLLLDCRRHFFSKDVIKKYIKLLSYYKMNVLHWHLTEDQGWRIAIEKYPKLTEIGAWRINEDGVKYGGFYSKEDIKEIVKYAEDLHVTIIPEIELPGHSQAAIAAYPHLSCTQQRVSVANDWGVFKEIYCAGNDSTFTFIEDVLTEVMELFPSEYIHIGGDEAPKYRWEHCSKCQKRIQDEGLKDEHELQSYFIQRVERFLNANGR
ncbi:MAG: beta-N-acetylhexosaminidase, partial [Flavobacteriales bacterium]|nr:beta-N-acetylhexosaminidase [Flavobacteriales bacterium]